MMSNRRDRARLLALEARVSALEHDRLADRLDFLRTSLDELGLDLDLPPDAPAEPSVGAP